MEANCAGQEASLLGAGEGLLAPRTAMSGAAGRSLFQVSEEEPASIRVVTDTGLSKGVSHSHWHRPRCTEEQRLEDIVQVKHLKGLLLKCPKKSNLAPAGTQDHRLPVPESEPSLRSNQSHP